MIITTEYGEKSHDIVAMFLETFTATEGPEAGQIIKDLAADMLGSLDDEDMYVFSAVESDKILASIIFTRLTYEQDPRTVFVLGPVAVSPPHQGKGLGQRLIKRGLEVLRERGVDVAITYGDVNFYSKVGFAQITEAHAQAPLPLHYPHGWLGQSLTDAQFTPLMGPSRCVAPLNDPKHW